MKKYLFFAAAALTLAACSNENEVDNSSPVELKLTSGLQIQTRANYTQATSIVKDEKVYSWVEDAGAKSVLYSARELTADENNGFKYTPMYFPATGNDVDIYAMHGNFTTPFTEGNDFPGTDGVAFTVTANQSGMGKAYTNSDLLYASKQGVKRTTGNVELNFYHMLSKIEIAIVSGPGAPELAEAQSVSIDNVITDGTFKPAKEDITEQSSRKGMIVAGNKKGLMYISQRISPDFSKEKVDYNEAVIVPQDMQGKIIFFDLKNGGKLSYTIPAFTDTPDAAVFESGKKYIYHITLTLTGLQVTSKIEDWTPYGTPIEGPAVM